MVGHLLLVEATVWGPESTQGIGLATMWQPGSSSGYLLVGTSSSKSLAFKWWGLTFADFIVM